MQAGHTRGHGHAPCPAHHTEHANAPRNCYLRSERAHTRYTKVRVPERQCLPLSWLTRCQVWAVSASCSPVYPLGLVVLGREGPVRTPADAGGRAGARPLQKTHGAQKSGLSEASPGPRGDSLENRSLSHGFSQLPKATAPDLEKETSCTWGKQRGLGQKPIHDVSGSGNPLSLLTSRDQRPAAWRGRADVGAEQMPSR